MHKDIAKLWTDALRSGEYKQGRNYLRKGDEFCCLGVLCDLASKSPDFPYGIQVDIFDNEVYQYELNQASLPPIIRMWAGMKNAGGKFCQENGLYYHLTHINDGGATFAEIADIIDKYVETL